MLPLPINLGFAGATGCTLNVDPALIELLVGDATGVAGYSLSIPGNQALRGQVLYQQPCKWDFATPINPVGIQPGWVARYVIGDRAF